MRLNKKKHPLISVIIPVYKVEAYLEKCLDSIINNTYKRLEIICINDGSPDDSISILTRYAELDTRIKIINQKNQGVSAARNRGLMEAHGEYIAFVDSDDYVHKHYFQSMINCILKTNADVVICSAKKVVESESVKDAIYKQIHYKRLNSHQFFQSYYARHMIWARLYKKSVLEGHRFQSEVRTGDDTLFNLEVISAIQHPIVYETNTVLYYYLQRDESIVHTSDYLGLKELSDYYHKSIFGNNKDVGTWSWLLNMQVIKSMLSYRYMVSYRPDAKQLKKESNQILFRYLKEMTNYTGIKVFEKMKHWVMFLLPEIYRRFRIFNDPTMLEWEKKEKSVWQ